MVSHVAQQKQMVDSHIFTPCASVQRTARVEANLVDTSLPLRQLRLCVVAVPFVARASQQSPRSAMRAIDL